MRDYINLSEIGTFDDLIYDMPVRIWDNPKPAKVLGITNDFLKLQNFKWYAAPGSGFGINSALCSGTVGFTEDLHLDQVWIESGWMLIILE